MSLFRKIKKYIWPQMRKYKGALYVILALFTFRVIFDSILIPFYFKSIIDNLSRSGTDRMLVSDQLFTLVYIIIGLNLLVAISARTRQFIYFNFIINVTRELRNFAFQRIEQNSYTFFSNTFAGSLVTKSRRFVFAFDTMFDIFIFNFLNFFIVLVGVFIVLTMESAVISATFFGLTVVYLAVVSFFVNRKMKYDVLEAAQDSRISGRLADVFSNISAVKFFSSREEEIRSFGKYTEEEAVRSRQFH